MAISPITSARRSVPGSTLAAILVSSAIPLGLAVTVALLTFIVGSGA